MTEWRAVREGGENKPGERAADKESFFVLYVCDCGEIQPNKLLWLMQLLSIKCDVVKMFNYVREMPLFTLLIWGIKAKYFLFIQSKINLHKIFDFFLLKLLYLQYFFIFIMVQITTLNLKVIVHSDRPIVLVLQPTTLLFWVDLVALDSIFSGSCFSEKAWWTHFMLPARHKTADRQN